MQTIGKYHLIRVLGHGGMGTVYEALDPHIKRRVAVKTMTPGLADDPVLRTRFLREAQAAGGLHHRNIVTVYDLGEDDGQPYIAMELVEGADLEAIVRQREPVTVHWKIDVLRQVCEGLAHAHRQGIVHRDVKPANIRVTPDGTVKIMDFGIAHLQSSTMTRGGQVLGTVHYMAPEQVDGRKVDHRADIFSVGAIAYELLCYRRAFDADSITGVLLKITQESADADALPHTEYSPEIERIVMKAMAREVADRYGWLEEMLEDLDRLQGASGASARPNGEAARAAALIEHGRAALAAGDAERALELAQEALARAPDDANGRALLREAEADALQRRVERELAEIRAEAARARADGRLQQALSLCRKVLELNPDDAEAARMAGEIEATVREREVEQLSAVALAYAADGDMELALKIADKITRLAPDSGKSRELRAYLEEQVGRRAADALVATAQDHLALGNLNEARAAAEEALAASPSNAIAREIRDRAGSILATRRHAEAAPTPAPPEPRPAPATPAPPPAPETATPRPRPAPPAVPPPEPVTLTPLPEGPPRHPEAARSVDAARRFLRERDPEKALPLLEEASALEPSHPGIQRLLTLTRAEARKAEAEALTNAALDHFMRNEYKKARATVEKALSLQPADKKAQELKTLLATLLA